MLKFNFVFSASCFYDLSHWTEMKAWNETGPQTSLRGELKIEGIQLLHVPFSTVQHQRRSPICILICFLLLICCGLLFFILRQSELCWENGLGKQNFTVILDCCRGPALSCLPSQGLPSFPNSCRCSLCQGPNHNRPITGQLCVWIWAALLNSSVCQYHSLALCLSFSFCHFPFFCFSL